MGCGTRVAGALLAVLLLAAPVAATTVMHSPFIPPDFAPPNGTVAVTVTLLDDGRLVQETTVFAPDGLSVDCGGTLPENGA